MIAQLNPAYIKTRPTKTISRLVSYFFFEGRPLTTKGRWINPFLFFLYKVFVLFPQVKKINAPVFIIGTGRSGSTLLGMLLSMHKDAGFLNEPKALWNFAFEKEDIIGNYTLQDAFYKLGEKNVNFKTTARLKKLYAVYLTSVFSKRVVDKYPELIFRIDFVKKIFPDAKFLFLQRNGIDTCASTDKWVQDNRIENKNDVEDWWGLNNRKWKLMIEQVVPSSKLLRPFIDKIKLVDNQADMAAVEWIATMEEGLDYQKKYPHDILPVKYEQLVTKPENVLREIFSFCKFSNDEKCVAYSKLVMEPSSRKNSSVVIQPFLKNCITLLMKELGY